MKYIKSFENKSNEPKIGDYVILYDDTFESNPYFNDYSYFINNNIGRIIDIKIRYIMSAYIDISYDVEYENIPDNIIKMLAAKQLKNGKIIHYEKSRSKSDITHIFKNKIDAELFIQTNKYNL